MSGDRKLSTDRDEKVAIALVDRSPEVKYDGQSFGPVDGVLGGGAVGGIGCLEILGPVLVASGGAGLVLCGVTGVVGGAVGGVLGTGNLVDQTLAERQPGSPPQPGVGTVKRHLDADSVSQVQVEFTTRVHEKAATWGVPGLAPEVFRLRGERPNYDQLRWQGVDKVLELEVTEIRIKSNGPILGLELSIVARTRLLRVADQSELGVAEYQSSTSTRLRDTDAGESLHKAFGRLYDDLVKKIWMASF